MLTSTIRSGIILYIRTLNTDEWTEIVVRLCALSVMFNVICYTLVKRKNRPYNRMLRAVAADVMIILNVRW